MRIIAGERKGAVLASPAGRDTRPTLARVRESLFSILAPVVADSVVVDLFAGAGMLGFEALSRGARTCVFVENARPALHALRANAAKLRYDTDRAPIVADDALRAVARALPGGRTADLVFADPPYDKGLAGRTLGALAGCPWLGAEALVILQHSAREGLPEVPATFALWRRERYGGTAVSFLRLAADEGAPPVAPPPPDGSA